MSGIVVQASAIKVVNKGGGVKDRMVTRTRETTKIIPAKEDGMPIRVPATEVWKERQRSKETGSDYVVFNCARCGGRNKRNLYDVKYVLDSGDVCFTCNKCRAMNEIRRPRPTIATPEQFDLEMRQEQAVIRGADGDRAFPGIIHSSR